MVNPERLLRCLFPAELSRPADPDPFHTGTQVSVEQQIGQRPGDFILRVGVKKDRSRVRDLRKGRRVRASDCTAAGHRLQNREPEAFIKRRKYKCIARSVEHEEVAIGYKASEAD